jgi:hypothetical protein
LSGRTNWQQPARGAVLSAVLADQMKGMKQLTCCSDKFDFVDNFLNSLGMKQLAS